MRGGNLGAVGATVVAVVVATAGCSGDDVTSKFHQATGSGLAAAMSHVANTEGSRNYFEYGDMAALRAKGVVDDPRFTRINGVGYPQLAASALLLPDVAGFDPRQARTAVFAGTPPTVSGALLGDFDAAAVTKKLDTGKSRKDGGGTLLVRHANNEIDANDPVVQAGIVTALNVVYASDSQIAYGSTEQALDSMRTTGSDTLAAHEPHASLARCLGDDVTAAILVKSGARTYGVGVQVSSKDDVTELLCVTADSSSDAHELATTIQGRLDTGSSPKTRQPWRELLTDPKAAAVSGDTNLVRVTARPVHDRPIGIFFDMLRVGDIDSLVS